jgi:impB/mucB/samB family
VSARRPVVCALLHPWPLHLLSQQHPGLPLAVLGEHGRRVLFANEAARALGVTVGLRESAALSRCPELHAEVVAGPAAMQAWTELVETLYARYSDRVEGRTPGVVFLNASVPAARELAAALKAQVGVADSLEVAQLAALRARPGEVRELPLDSEKVYLPLSLTEHLHVLGLVAEQVRKLEFLGIRGLADLMKWSAGQREAFLGVTIGKRLNRFLKGERTTAVARHVPDQTLETTLRFGDALSEPGEAEAALLEMMPGLFLSLKGRTAAYLTIHADTLGGRLSSTRKLKWPLLESGVRRLALRMLLDTDALPLGLDALTLCFSGLQQPSRQVGLWTGLTELDALQAVLERFPAALVRVEWRNPYALTADARYVWVDWQTGAERPRPMAPGGIDSAEPVPAPSPVQTLLLQASD